MQLITRDNKMSITRALLRDRRIIMIFYWSVVGQSSVNAFIPIIHLIEYNIKAGQVNDFILTQLS